MFTKTFKVVVIFLFTIGFGHAQNCVLEIGGKDYATIVNVFQLNEAQKQQVEDWRSQLEVEKKIINEEAEKLFETHPQSTPEDLIALGQKYNVIKEKLLNITLVYDLKLIATFNKKQYERYISLCREALRKPLVVTSK